MVWWIIKSGNQLRALAVIELDSGKIIGVEDEDINYITQPDSEIRFIFTYVQTLNFVEKGNLECNN